LPLSIPGAQNLCGRNFISQFLIGLVDADSGAGSGRKAAVGIERDALLWQKIERLGDACDDRFRRIDLARRNTDATQPNLEVFAQLLEDGISPAAGEVNSIVRW